MKAACSSCGTLYSSPSVDSSASDVRVRCENCGNVFDIQGPARDNQPRTPRGQWYYAADGESFGPYTEGELLEKYQTNELDEDTYVWTKGFEEWIPAKEHGAFATAIAYAVHQRRQPESSPKRGNYDTPVDALDALPEDPLYYSDDTIEYTPDDIPSDDGFESQGALADHAGPFDADMFDDTTEESIAKTASNAASDAASDAPSDAPSAQTSDAPSAKTSDAAKQKKVSAPKKPKSKRAAKREKVAPKKARPLPPPLTPDRALESTTSPKPRRKTAVMAALRVSGPRPAAPPTPQTSPKPANESDAASGPTLSLAERLREMRDRPARTASSPTPAPRSSTPTLPPRDDEPATAQPSTPEPDLPLQRKPKTIRNIRLVTLNEPPTDVAKPTDTTSGKPKKSQTVRMVALNAPPTDASPPNDTKPPASSASKAKPAQAKKGGTIMLGALPTRSEDAEKAVPKQAPKKEEPKQVVEPTARPARAKKGGTIMLGALPTPSEDAPKPVAGTHATIDRTPPKEKTRVDEKPAAISSKVSSVADSTPAADTSHEPRTKSAAPTSTTSAPVAPTNEKSSRRGMAMLFMVVLLGVITFFGWRLLFSNTKKPLPAATTAATESPPIEEDTAWWDEAHAEAQSIFFGAGDAAEAAALEAGILAQNQRIEARDHASATLVAALPAAERAAQEAAEKAAAEAEAARRRAIAPRPRRAPQRSAPSPLDNTAVQSNEARVPNAPPRPRRQNQNAPTRRSNTN